MKNTRKNEFRIARAKRTAFGRFLCRLAGEETGAVMMEYVVLGVMVVAAVVAVVLLFGKQIRVNFDKMTKATKGDSKSAGQVQDVTNADIQKARQEGAGIASDAGDVGD